MAKRKPAAPSRKKEGAAGAIELTESELGEVQGGQKFVVVDRPRSYTGPSLEPSEGAPLNEGWTEFHTVPQRRKDWAR